VYNRPGPRTSVPSTHTELPTLWVSQTVTHRTVDTDHRDCHKVKLLSRKIHANA